MTDTPGTQPAAESIQDIIAEILAHPPTTSAGLLADCKTLLQSRTVICALIGIVAAFLKDHGHALSAGDQTSLVTDILSLVQYAGLVGAIVFRVLATKAVA